MKERNLDFEWVASVAGARGVRGAERIQALWGGYGEIVRVALEGAPVASVVVKVVAPPAGAQGVSDVRKRRSYEVEGAFYEGYAERCDARCRVARRLGCRAVESSRWIVLEDLDAAGYSERRSHADRKVLERCVAWLAAFHARFLGATPEGLWSTGTYWHLSTRLDELSSIEDPRVRAIAPALDARLAGAQHVTLVHGDAKLANFCFAPTTDGVAAVDFQYVGGGPGVRDVAYLLTGEVDERAILDVYFGDLRRELSSRGVDAAPIEAEWRALYPFACADFHRFLAGWAPSHHRRDAHGRRVVAEMVERLAGEG